MKPEFLFIEYANADLRKNPEFLLKISEYLNKHYQDTYKEAGYMPFLGAPPLDDPVFFHVPVGHGSGFIREVFKKLISDYENLKSHLDKACPTDVLFHAGNIKYLNKDDWEAAIKICACEGTFYWAMGNQGCDECKYNMMGQRNIFNKTQTNACFVCDWLAFRETLSSWAAGNSIWPGHHDLLEAFNQLNHKEDVIRKNGSSEDYQFLSLIDSVDWLAAPQRFSQIVMAVLWDDIKRFLSRKKVKKSSPDPAQLIKQCQICKNYFIADRSIATNCLDCTGKETPEALRKRQANHRAKNERDILNKLRKIGRKRGVSDSDINAILEHFIQDGCSPKEILRMPEADIFPPEG